MKGDALAMKKILVVDDEPFILRSLTYVLEKSGYEAYTAADGSEALEMLETVKPDLIFLDVMMPNLSGFETCRRIRDMDQFKNVHIIMLTAKGQEKDRIKGLAYGANEYMTKPFSPSKILQRLREIFAENEVTL